MVQTIHDSSMVQKANTSAGDDMFLQLVQANIGNHFSAGAQCDTTLLANGYQGPLRYLFALEMC